MTTLINWNVKADSNVSCWTCDHFQRYDKKEQPTVCAGDCRRQAPRGSIRGNYGGSYIVFDWALIINAPVYWCSFWERSTENPIPPFPVPPPQQLSDKDKQAGQTGQTNGQDFEFCRRYFQFPDDWQTWEPWNRKEKKNVSCWGCDHFQRRFDDLSSTQEPCGGECRKNPPEPIRVQNQDSLLGRAAFITPAPLFWCGEFERSMRVVPNKPENCFQGPTVSHRVDIDDMIDEHPKGEKKDNDDKKKAKK